LRKRVRRAEEVEEPLAAHPAAPVHDLVLHHRDVRRGSAEPEDAQLQEGARDLGERLARGRAH
jgi:hypothetical protein